MVTGNFQPFKRSEKWPFWRFCFIPLYRGVANEVWRGVHLSTYPKTLTELRTSFSKSDLLRGVVWSENDFLYYFTIIFNLQGFENLEGLRFALHLRLGTSWKSCAKPIEKQTNYPSASHPPFLWKDLSLILSYKARKLLYVSLHKGGVRRTEGFQFNPRFILPLVATKQVLN